MDKIQSLFADLQNASQRLSEALSLPVTDINRDAAIQRFEFTFELFWKLLQTILTDNGIQSYGPKNAIREAGKMGIIEDVEQWLTFLTARNLTSHTYNEKTAQEVYDEAKLFFAALQLTYTHIQTYLNS